MHRSVALVALLLVGCVSIDDEIRIARMAILSGEYDKAATWSEELANSAYSKNLGVVEAGRVQMLKGDFVKAEEWFRQAIDSSVEHKERDPKIKLGDVGNTVLASTITDDRTRNYYLQPYELNLALSYVIIAQAVNGKREDALVDARLAVYLQDNLASQYEADVADKWTTRRAVGQIVSEQSVQMQDVMLGTRNSRENAVLWWLTGVLFEADGDLQMAWQSYRKAWAVRGDCSVFKADVERANLEQKTPIGGKAKLVVIYEEGLVPTRESLKVSVPFYTMMAIDIPQYAERAPYCPSQVVISGATALVAAEPALNVRALAYRDLNERLPGIVARNITRMSLQAGAQVAANHCGNKYAKLAVLLVNTTASSARRADTRSWITLPDGQQVWEDGAMNPGEYRIGIRVNGRLAEVPLSLASGETKFLWIADTGCEFRTAIANFTGGKSI